MKLDQTHQEFLEKLLESLEKESDKISETNEAGEKQISIKFTIKRQPVCPKNCVRAQNGICICRIIEF